MDDQVQALIAIGRSAVAYRRAALGRFAEAPSHTHTHDWTLEDMLMEHHALIGSYMERFRDDD